MHDIKMHCHWNQFKIENKKYLAEMLQIIKMRSFNYC
jgi:hypothetical protein